MTLLATFYASAPSDDPIVWTLELRRPSAPSEYLAAGFDDVVATLENGATVTFIGRAIDVSLPGADASGNQTLTFAIDNATEAAQAYVDASIEDGETVTVILRQFRLVDLSAPADTPLELPVVGGSFADSQLQVQAVVNDLLATAWPRNRYTAAYAPGVRYAG